MKILPDDPVEALQQARTILRIEELAGILGVSCRSVNRYLSGETRPKKGIIAALRVHLAGNGPGRKNPDFRFIDLFAGIGGIRRAFESQGGQCVWTSEWDKFSRQTYTANFPDEHELAGDITKVDAARIPDHDVLLAGFPCQPFSLAGVSKKNSLGRLHGFNDPTQGTLFFDVKRIIAAKRPKAFLLENVKNLQSHDEGRTFGVIRHTLEKELGYRIHVKVVDGIHWVPQHRERIFIVGFAVDVPFDWNDLRLPSSKPKLRDILHGPEEDPEDPYTERFRGRTRVSPRYTLSDHLWNYLQDYAAKHAAKGNGFGCSVVGPEDTARTLSARYHKDGSEILVSQGKGKNPRRLTPRECARLMGFDRPNNPAVKIPVSDTQAYRQFGNAVVVPAVEEVARIMIPHLNAIHIQGAPAVGVVGPLYYQPELIPA
jgi:DNA (cytosine-5)-methyltransferase 1